MVDILMAFTSALAAPCAPRLARWVRWACGVTVVDCATGRPRSTTTREVTLYRGNNARGCTSCAPSHSSHFFNMRPHAWGRKLDLYYNYGDSPPIGTTLMVVLAFGIGILSGKPRGCGLEAAIEGCLDSRRKKGVHVSCLILERPWGGSSRSTIHLQLRVWFWKFGSPI